jgi:hypothetical protein
MKVGVCFLGESGCTGADEGNLLSCSSDTSKPMSKAKRAITLPFKIFVMRLSLQSAMGFFYKAIFGYFLGLTGELIQASGTLSKKKGSGCSPFDI